MSRLRVPEEDGARLIVPPLAEVGSLLGRSVERLGRADVPILDRSFQDVRRLARRELTGTTDTPVLAAGHQPELFHPGVWLKNFVLNRLAQAHHAIPLGFIVDNDAVKSASLTVLTVDVPLRPVEEGGPRIVPVPLDHVAPGLPYEEWTVRDEAFFASLPDRLPQGWPGTIQPLLPVFWKEVCEESDRTCSVPERLASARRTFERRWGCDNREVPVSHVSRSEAFRYVAAAIMANLPRFHAVFNEAMRTYRRAHRLRSRHHPFPDLARDGDWLESPFWAWRSGEGRRHRLFVRPISDGVALRWGGETGPVLSRARLPQEFEHLEQEGTKLRPRALTTTLFLRLFASDLFIHGIGGGKYDEATDEVIRAFFNIEPPPFLVVTGTLRLPLPVYPATTATVRALRRLRRDLEFNPQRYLPEDPETRPFLKERKEWVERQPPTRTGRRERFRTLRRLTGTLASSLSAHRQEVEGKLQHAEAEVEANALLRRRDWAFCLYPEDVLRDFLCGREA